MSSQFTNADYIPQRVGLQFTPPTIVIEYLLLTTQKLYRHKIRLNSLTGNSDIIQITNYVRQRHIKYVSNNKITDDQLQTLIARLIIRQADSQKVANSQCKGQLIKNGNPQPTNALYQFQEIEIEPEYSDDFEEQSNSNSSINYENFDLNKLSPEELIKHKQKMDIHYKKNIINPGDKDFQYDKQVEFNPKINSNWDDDI